VTANDPTITVRQTINFQAVQSTHPEAEKILLGWFREANPDVPVEVTDIGLPQAQEAGIWFLRHPSGQVIAIGPDDLESDFEKVSEEDEIEEFVKLLADSPSAQVADKSEERIQAQAQIDAFLADRVGQMLSEFEDLLGMAQDEEDADASEGIQWAYERFKAVFGVKENPSSHPL